MPRVTIKIHDSRFTIHAEAKQDMEPTRETYYYSRVHRLYETSLDVYKPALPPPDGAPLVVVVVGSAWLGHQPAIYIGTDWWNSSGPKTIASLGCVCVAIRHRGAFICAPPAWAALLLVAVLAAQAMLHAAVPTAAMLCLSMWTAWAWAARGAASHDDMLDDVGSALVWVKANQHRLVAPGAEQVSAVHLFGGYSSGGHVAASLLQAPEKLTAKGLALPAAGYDGILLLSGVLGARSSEPQPPCLPAALATAGLAKLTFGWRGAAVLPSPLHTPERCPKVPHLLVHCRHEVFNLPLLEAALSHLLCSELYAAALRRLGVPTRIESVESDHWFVLGSQALRDALRKALIDDRFGAPKEAPTK